VERGRSVKVASKSIDKVKTEMDCSFVIQVFEGVEITMYGAIVDGKPDMASVGPSFWNDKEFRALQNDVQKAVIQATKEALAELAREGGGE
jgi:hypothetical protein